MKGRAYLTPSAIAKIGNLQLVARLVVEGATAGQHKSPDFGFNVEFSEHRRYMPGDELRHIDWKLFAKSDKHYIKLYEENTSLRSYVLLDRSASMGFGQGPLNKLDYGKYLAASILYLLLHQRDSVGLGTFSNSLGEIIHPSNKASHLHRMLEHLDGITPLGETKVHTVLKDLALSIKRRALIIVISDFFDDTEKVLEAVHNLRFLKHDVILLRTLAPEEIDFPYKEYSRFIDMENNEEVLFDARTLAHEYKKRMAEHIQQFRQKLHFNHVDTELFRTDQALEDVLAGFLQRRARRRTA
jgi:uncharacterized protein (DUF58 family)